MCGIIGFISNNRVAPTIMNCLRTLEYRGYDSSGMATIYNGEILCKKGVGAVDMVNSTYQLDELEGSIGIGHVRWATHGNVSVNNAHPHLDCNSQIALVHNGIIENYQELRKQLAENHKLVSDTDTEVISHLIEEYFTENVTFHEAVLRAIRRLQGSYAIAVVSSLDPNMIVAAKKESPLLVGIGNNGNYVASDVVSILDKAEKIIPLDDGEIAIVRSDKVTILNEKGQVISKQPEEVHFHWELPTNNGNGHVHYMSKEIYEEPDVIESAIQQDDKELMELALEILRSRQVVIIACGTSRHAGLIGRYLFSNLASKFCEVVMASEFEYFSESIDPNTVVIAISQSGETADVIAGVKMARAKGARVLSMVNVPGSTLTRMSDRVIYLNCGPEMSVAATKTFVAQLAIFYMLTFAMLNQIDKGRELLRVINKQISINLNTNGVKVRQLGNEIREKSDFYFLARGINFAVALEGALKLKEISYIHAEGMPAGELKHGTLALIDEGTPVLVICPKDNTYYDTLSNAMETKARGAFIIGLSDENNEIFDEWIEIPKVDEIFYPLVCVIPLQLLAYHAAVARGKNPDRPRNLAKSVTVK
ncbi:glutamine--fructose-6-phosphate transaminase (isomerizing) [Chloroflexota bacterium]